MFENISITDAIGALTLLAGGILAVWGTIVKMTKSKKDDEIFEKVEGAVKPVLDGVSKPKV